MLRLVVLCTRMALVNLYNLYVLYLLIYVNIKEWICCDSVDMIGMRCECWMTVESVGVLSLSLRV